MGWIPRSGGSRRGGRATRVWAVNSCRFRCELRLEAQGSNMEAKSLGGGSRLRILISVSSRS